MTENKPTLPLPLFTKEHGYMMKEAPTYQKRVLTPALKIPGPFEVETSEGRVTCQDGYLAFDSRGYPYPIATEEFERIYVLVDGRRFK